MSVSRSGAAIALALGLAGCALPRPQAPEPPLPPQWYAPLPHGGTVGGLMQWWKQLDDPLLAELLDSAQQASPTVASARARIVQARSTRTAARASLIPAVDGTASASYGTVQTVAPAATEGTTLQAGLQANWELDLFGGNRATADAAGARVDAAQAGWHDARVSVAAETANLYFSLRACRRQLAVARNDAASRAETARLTELVANAGFQAPANAALARASAADGAALAAQRAAQCEIDVKALVALTAMAEPELRRKMDAAAPDRVDPPSLPGLAQPAAIVAQRPDVFQAEREVRAVAAEVASADAQRFPKLGLAGFLGFTRYRVAGTNADQDSWTFGPLSLSLPIFDGGRRAANAEAQRARHEEAVALRDARVRQAVQEVEEALVRLDSTAARAENARVATEGYRAALEAAQARYRSGFGTLIELEDVRRSTLAAETALVELQRERQAAWIALYRATGGGWERPKE